jgi:cytochrome c biogenesis factor
MILRIFKAMWFVSLMATLASLLWVYAGLPEQVVVQEDTGGRIEVNREFFFYVLTFLIVVVNVLVYLFKKLQAEDFRAWFHGLVITINVFLMLAMNVVQTYNSGENFNFGKIGFILYASVGLVVVWSVSWPVYSLFKKNIAEQPVL